MPTTIVVPCYNEAKRLDGDAFHRFVQSTEAVNFIFVDDGSTDDTLGVLRQLVARMPDRARCIALGQNGGKAAAVRQGMSAAIADRPAVAGYWDADLATPLSAIPAMLRQLRSSDEVCAVLAARVRLLGRSIDRRPMRHYVGRVFATLASVTLDMPVYDTQCGAKLFRVSDELLTVFEEPFISRWIFVVEILALIVAARRRRSERLDPGMYIHEHPLESWRDVHGSKVRPLDFAIAGRDLFRIWRRYRPARPTLA